MGLAPPEIGLAGRMLQILALIPSEYLCISSLGGLVLLVWKMDWPVADATWGPIEGVNPFLMAFCAFLAQLAVVTGIALALGVLNRSGSTRPGASAEAARLIYDCTGTWLRICAVCAFNYLMLGLRVFPPVLVGNRPIFVARIAEWLYTVPLVWYVYARVYTGAGEADLREVVAVNSLMLTVGYIDILWLRYTALHVPTFGLACCLFVLQVKRTWDLPLHQCTQTRDLGRKAFITTQSMIMFYPIVWALGDLGLTDPLIEQLWVYTLLDIFCKLALVWCCLVLRLVQAFPALHVGLEGWRQFLDASHDIRLILDEKFKICGVDGNMSLLHHYLGDREVMGCDFRDFCHGDSEKARFMRVVLLLDKQGPEALSPKLRLLLVRKTREDEESLKSGYLRSPSGSMCSTVGAECVVSSARSGLRLLAVTFTEIMEGPLDLMRRQMSPHPDFRSSITSSENQNQRQFTPPLTVSELDWHRSCTPVSKRLGRGCSFQQEDERSVAQTAVSNRSRRSTASYMTAVTTWQHVQYISQSLGHLLEDEVEPAFLADAMSADYPIVAVSRGFLQLTGYNQEEVLGHSLSFFEEGVPEEVLSKSTRKNFASFCQSCRVDRNTAVGDIQMVQPHRRRDGAIFVNMCFCSLVRLRNRPYILGIPSNIAEGTFARLKDSAMDAKKEESRQKIRVLRENVTQRAEARRLVSKVVSKGLQAPPLSEEEEDDEESVARRARFFSDNLQDHCILLNWNRSAVRREPYELPIGCLVFSQQSVPWSGSGLSFSMLIDELTPHFDGLPLMGFTRRAPKDSADCYPKQAQCLGASVSIGRNGEAFARDQWEHTFMGFKKLPQEELRTWCQDPTKAPHLQRAPCKVEPGDILECRWHADGHLQMLRNGETILTFDMERRPELGVQYHALVDVCFSVAQVTLLPFPPSDSRSSSIEEEPDAEPCLESTIRSSVLELVASEAISRTVAECNFCVTVADPHQPDCPLIAVSKEFMRMTGYDGSQLLGRNCRVLNTNCCVRPEELMALRRAEQTGERVTMLLENRRCNGELFTNLLDLCGFRIARDLDTGEDVWYLIGVQADVTKTVTDDLSRDHLEALQQVAWGIRQRLAHELRKMVLSGSSNSAESENLAEEDSFEDDRGISEDSTQESVATRRNNHHRRIQVLERPEWLGGPQQMALQLPLKTSTNTPMLVPPSTESTASTKESAASAKPCSAAASSTDRSAAATPRDPITETQRTMWLHRAAIWAPIVLVPAVVLPYLMRRARAR